MRDEGFVPGLHYAPLGEDVVRDVRYWLARPEERARIAREGQKLVMGNLHTNIACVRCTAINGD